MAWKNKVCRPSHSRGKPFPRERPRRGYSAGGIRETLSDRSELRSLLFIRRPFIPARQAGGVFWPLPIKLLRATQTAHLKCSCFNVFGAANANQNRRPVRLFNPVAVFLKCVASESGFLFMFRHVHYSTNVSAFPFLPARPVRPMRWT